MSNNMLSLSIIDTSSNPKFGVKGAHAMQWLTERAIVIPKNMNQWEMGADDSFVLRLGDSEFLIESQRSALVQMLHQASVQHAVSSVYFVPREDASFLLVGEVANRLMREVCSLDFESQADDSQALYMTQVAGISAIVIKQNLDDQTVYRIWCDASYRLYMQSTLIEIGNSIATVKTENIQLPSKLTHSEQIV